MNLLVALILFAAASAAQNRHQPVRAVIDPGVVTTRQTITPAGVSSVFQGRTYGVAWAGDSGELWVLHASSLYRLDWKNNRIVSHITHGGNPGNQSLASDPATGTAYFGESVRESGRANARLASVNPSGLNDVASKLGRFQPGALSISSAPTRKYAAVPLVWENRLAIVDLNRGKVVTCVPTGVAPFAAAINGAGTVAYVSNLGGRPPNPGESFASPRDKPEEEITIDGRGIAATGSVTRVDTAAGQATDTIAVGLHPTALALDENRSRLYVANGNSDTVSVIDTTGNTVVQTIRLQPFSDDVRGIAPTALQLDASGRTLFVACGGINAVAVVETASGRLQGLIPTGWYPNALAIEPGGEHLAVSSLLGAGSAWRDTPRKRFALAYRGSIAVLPIPDAAQLASYTTAVAENNRLRLRGAAPESARAAAHVATPRAIPLRSGEPSLIEHVVFIIKENRTYDQVLGDVKKGNGDSSLVMFGEEVTPNQHRLAEQFVLLDNFYATGGNSADGHQWLTQANETEYCLWPGYQGRSYPFDGSDPLAYSSGGFLWDYALARGRTVRVYGEYAGRMEDLGPKDRIGLLRKWERGDDFSNSWSIRPPIDPLKNILAANYPSYSTAIPDLIRAQIFMKDLRHFEQQGNLPNLILLQLPSDHTYGTVPGTSTPKAMVADNDYAVGQIVEALSRSKYWAKMVIFIVEDDAQDGVDHVDGHRTTAFVASPYARRGSIDSMFYAHQSILKTIELILGLPTMSIFDLIATEMRTSFTDMPDLAPYTAVRPKQDIFELNPAADALSGEARAGALASSTMNFSVPDAVPTQRLNRILWGAVKGWRTSYPEPRRSAFAPLSLDVDDDDR